VSADDRPMGRWTEFVNSWLRRGIAEGYRRDELVDLIAGYGPWQRKGLSLRDRRVVGEMADALLVAAGAMNEREADVAQAGLSGPWHDPADSWTKDELRAAWRDQQPTGPTRPPVVPDLEPVMRSAIASLRARNTQLTWRAVATEIAAMLGTSYTDSTLRRNATAAGLPHPAKPYWR
jgi:hypothetical protein